MKKTLLKIFVIASIITVLGFIMDGDPKEPSMAMRFIEFFAMLATTFVVISIGYFATTFTYRKIAN